MLLVTLSYSKFEIIQLLREELAPKSTVIRKMCVGRIFLQRGRSLADFSRSSHKDLSTGEPKVVKFHFSFSKLRKQNLFAKNVVFKNPGRQGPLSHLPTPMSRKHKRSQGGPKRPCPPLKFLENMVILCFERSLSKQNRVIRLKSNSLAPRNFRAGYATGRKMFFILGVLMAFALPLPTDSLPSVFLTCD